MPADIPVRLLCHPRGTPVCPAPLISPFPSSTVRLCTSGNALCRPSLCHCAGRRPMRCTARRLCSCRLAVCRPLCTAPPSALVHTDKALATALVPPTCSVRPVAVRVPLSSRLVRDSSLPSDACFRPSCLAVTFALTSLLSAKSPCHALGSYACIPSALAAPRSSIRSAPAAPAISLPFLFHISSLAVPLRAATTGYHESWASALGSKSWVGLGCPLSTGTDTDVPPPCRAYRSRWHSSPPCS